jgi:hypothetical protein
MERGHRSYKLNSFIFLINKSMRIFELEKPKTPEQLKLDQLRATSKRASEALKIERDRQKVTGWPPTRLRVSSNPTNSPRFTSWRQTQRIG